MAIKNASIVIVTGKKHDRLFMVRSTSSGKKWMFPGGIIDRKDGGPNGREYAAMEREFEEETGFELPPLTGNPSKNNELFYYDATHKDRSKTRIYLGYTSDRNINLVDLYNKPAAKKVRIKNKNETDKAYSVCYSSLKKNDFAKWSSRMHRGLQDVRKSNTHSLKSMSNTDPTKKELKKVLANAKGAGGCAQPQPPQPQPPQPPCACALLNSLAA